MRNQISNFKLKIFSLIFAIFYLLFAITQVKALTMSNSNYTLQMGNLNMAAGKPTGANYKLGVTVGETAPGLYTGTNYKVRAGFQYIHSLISFRFSITQTFIDFGVISATEPVTRTGDLIITNGSAHGYSVTALEDHELLVPASGNLIPDTTCDNGTCTQSTSALWSSNLTYGFGYRCDNVTGTDCASGFSDANYYKQFADNSKSESPVAVMSGTNVGKNKRVTITYKVNISGVQPSGLYGNVITYVATPTF